MNRTFYSINGNYAYSPFKEPAYIILHLLNLNLEFVKLELLSKYVILSSSQIPTFFSNFLNIFFHPNLRAKVIYNRNNNSGEYANEINTYTLIGIQPLSHTLILIIPKSLQPNVIDLRNLEKSKFKISKVYTIRLQRYRNYKI